MRLPLMKRWRYVGVYGPDLMCCFGRVSIGGRPQTFWALWDREARELRERTRFRDAAVQLEPGMVRVRDRGVAVDLFFDEHAHPAWEVTTGPIWTRKRIIAVSGSVVIDGRERTLLARGIVDDSAGRHDRDTAWSWSAGVGTAVGGELVAWNLVDGIHDGATGSERAVWVDGAPTEAPPALFDAALTEVRSADGAVALRCAHEAVRRRDDNFGLVRSRYEQPFGTFTGTLPGGLVLADGFGVMERHDVRW
ncbi:MAG: DUF2804 domain-containing protein [Solirubrobacteraceae bacterium]